MSRYDGNYRGGGSIAIYVLIFMVSCYIYSCCNSSERQATTDVQTTTTSTGDGYYDEEGNYVENNSNLYEDLSKDYKINYLGYNIDKSKYRDVEYEPYTHKN